MKEEGYDMEFSAAITAASSTVGPIIPPSTTMITYAVVAEVSVARLFIGGFLPGVFIGLIMMLYVRLVSTRQYNFPTRPKANRAEVLKAIKEAFLPCLTPIIIILGIVSGITTATEAGAVAVIYSLVLTYYYNRFSWKDFLKILEGAVSTTIKICFIVIASGLFGWVITMAQIPALVSEFLFSAGIDKWLILILINLLLLFMGCFLSITSAILIITPVLVVIAQAYNIDLVHLGVFMTLNLTIGLLTPPVGWNLYIVSELAGLSFNQMVKATLPFLIPLLISLIVITYFPETVLWLPNMLFK
jgi:tripartite ATP-independent transporter DctM subunit